MNDIHLMIEFHKGTIIGHLNVRSLWSKIDYKSNKGVGIGKKDK